METLDFLSIINLSDSNLHVVATGALMGLVGIPNRFYKVEGMDNTENIIDLKTVSSQIK